MPKSLLKDESWRSGFALSLAIFSTADRLRRPPPPLSSLLSLSDIAGLVWHCGAERNRVGP